jgi:glutamyl/glutaminyl-tRNA synthetase
MMEAGEELELKGAKLMKPIRIQLTGEGSGPDIATIIEIFGKEKTLERLNNG